MRIAGWLLLICVGLSPLYCVYRSEQIEYEARCVELNEKFNGKVVTVRSATVINGFHKSIIELDGRRWYLSQDRLLTPRKGEQWLVRAEEDMVYFESRVK